jgi:hypothetical protein
MEVACEGSQPFKSQHTDRPAHKELREALSAREANLVEQNIAAGNPSGRQINTHEPVGCRCAPCPRSTQQAQPQVTPSSPGEEVGGRWGYFQELVIK